MDLTYIYLYRDYLIRFWSIFVVTLTLNFHGQKNLLSLRQKWAFCHETKSKLIDWTRMWSSDLTLAMTLTMNFQCQIWNLLYLSKNGNISIELLALNVTIWFDLGYGHDLQFSRSNIQFITSQPKVVRLPLNKTNIAIELKSWLTIEYDLGHDLERWGVRIYRISDSDRGDFRCRCAVDSSSFQIHCWFSSPKSMKLLTHKKLQVRRNMKKRFRYSKNDFQKLGGNYWNV